MSSINVERKLAVINGFVEIPDGQFNLRTKLTPDDVLALIPGSKLIRLSPYSNSEQVISISVNPSTAFGVVKKISRLFIKLPPFDSFTGYPTDWYNTLREAAKQV